VQADKPNIIFILADDLGYGDVSCYNSDGKIPTPNLDKLAAEGLRFTDAHATSAVCTPSRYSLLTGRYCWRKMPMGIVGPYGDTILPPERMTVANLLRDNGYSTACFGKWHLGMGWHKDNDSYDFTKPIKSGPISNGFDDYFGVDVPNWPPFCFIENRNTVGIPAHEIPLETGVEGISYKGPCVEDWTLENILPEITNRTCNYIEEHAHTDKPFFVYFPLTSPHTPLAVNEPWKGASGLNLYADFVMETDAMVGRVMDTIEKAGISDNTLVLFASDNGFAHYVGAEFLESRGHFPSYIYRGYKFHAWDGGHRIPFIAHWPKTIAPGMVYDHHVSLADFFATVAEINDIHVPDNAAEDSVSLLPILEGSIKPVREAVISHSYKGMFAVRKGKWKLILCSGGGSFDEISNGEALEQGLKPYQLYDMEADPSETTNLYPHCPEIFDELVALLKDYVNRGRSTPGKPQKNDLTNINIGV